jgi:hypothetical protein
MNKATAYFALSTLAVSAALFTACDEDTVPLRDAPDAAGAEASTPKDSGGSSGHPGKAQQTGRIVDLGSQGTGVGGATITIGGQTITADAKGNYSVLYDLNTPVSMVVTAPSYFKLLEAEWLLKADASRGPTRLPSVDSATSLLAALSLAGPVDKALGVISVWAIPMKGCASEEGATFDISPKGANTIAVFLKGTLPNTALQGAVAGENPHVVIYNVPIGPVTVTVKHPTCSQLPYPQTDTDGFTYTGKATVEPEMNNTLSFLRVFLGPHVDVDAGTDAGTDASFDAADQ